MNLLNKLEQLEFKLEKKMVFRKIQEKLEKAIKFITVITHVVVASQVLLIILQALDKAYIVLSSCNCCF